MPASEQAPVLWHLKVSNYNEKARWALDYKGVAHVRRAATPGRHRAIAARLSGADTFPILIIDGETIADSTAIIAALERRQPEPPLYPSERAQRAEALELEDFFDEDLGPYVRLLAVHHLLPHPTLLLATFVPDLPSSARVIARAGFPLIRRQVRADFGINAQTVAEAYVKVRTAGERFRAKVGAGGYLVGGSFSVADLTLAALIAPAVAPEQFPYPQPQRGHPAVAELREALDESGLIDWTHEMYARHRGTSAEIQDRSRLS